MNLLLELRKMCKYTYLFEEMDETPQSTTILLEETEFEEETGTSMSIIICSYPF